MMVIIKLSPVTKSSNKVYVASELDASGRIR